MDTITITEHLLNLNTLQCALEEQIESVVSDLTTQRGRRMYYGVTEWIHTGYSVPLMNRPIQIHTLVEYWQVPGVKNMFIGSTGRLIRRNGAGQARHALFSEIDAGELIQVSAGLRILQRHIHSLN